MISIVPDTNIIVSGHRYGGNEYTLLKAIHEKQVTAFTSPHIIAEIERVLAYPKLKISVGDREKILADFRNKAKQVKPNKSTR